MAPRENEFDTPVLEKEKVITKEDLRSGILYLREEFTPANDFLQMLRKSQPTATARRLIGHFLLLSARFHVHVL